MTDSQIVDAYLARLLYNVLPDHGVLREISETRLFHDRCARLSKKIVDACDKLREPMVQRLNDARHETT